MKSKKIKKKPSPARAPLPSTPGSLQTLLSPPAPYSPGPCSRSPPFSPFLPFPALRPALGALKVALSKAA